MWDLLHTALRQVPRRRWLLVLIGGFIVFGGLACQVEVRVRRQAGAQRVAGVEAESRTIPQERSVATPVASPIPDSGVLPMTDAIPDPVAPASTPPERIVAPAIGLDAPVVPAGWRAVVRDGRRVSVWDVPETAAGWHKNSARPGAGGNVVLSGHHNRGTEVFRYLVDLQPGNRVMLQAEGRAYWYVVIDRFILPERGVPEAQRRQNASWIMPTRVERLTLVTCWPYTDNSHRVIVVAEPVHDGQVVPATSS